MTIRCHNNIWALFFENQFIQRHALAAPLSPTLGNHDKVDHDATTSID